MKGAVVSTTIVVALVVILVAVAGFAFYSQGGLTQKTSSVADCQGKVNSYCKSWSATGYDRAAVLKDGKVGPWENYASGCTAAGVSAPTNSVCDRVLAK